MLGSTNEQGVYTSPMMFPGTYDLLAVDSEVTGADADLFARLWRARNRAKRVELGNNATVEVALTPAPLP
ncbi:MAG TPA: hypothetical protein DEH78_23270 [Solibacterales bacterium]|nr:hypothetical protein [Bryobacterales bacterium]